MEQRKVAIVLFYNHEGKIILQNRRKKSKAGEHYGFFGGQIEEGETPEQALKREIKEELDIDIHNHVFFKTRTDEFKDKNIAATRWLYLSPFPDLSKVNVNEGELEIFDFTDALKLKMIPGDDIILKEAYDYLKNKLSKK